MAGDRTARMHYRIRDVNAYAAAFARRAHRLDVEHGVRSTRAKLAAACVSGIQRLPPG